jgi:ATP-dependent 26S proteasome regulatory subunit
MVELITSLEGFHSPGNIKVLMATNRPDTLDPAIVRPGEVGYLDGRKGIRLELFAFGK